MGNDDAWGLLGAKGTRKKVRTDNWDKGENVDGRPVVCRGLIIMDSKKAASLIARTTRGKLAHRGERERPTKRGKTRLLTPPGGTQSCAYKPHKCSN